MSKLKEEELLEELAYAYGCSIISKQAYQQTVALIQKPGVTEEWVEEKAKELREKTYIAEPMHGYGLDLDIAKDFIRSFVEKMPAKKLIVPKGFVEKWWIKLKEQQVKHPGQLTNFIKEMINGLGLEVVEE